MSRAMFIVSRESGDALNFFMIFTFPFVRTEFLSDHSHNYRIPKWQLIMLASINKKKGFYRSKSFIMVKEERRLLRKKYWQPVELVEL